MAHSREREKIVCLQRDTVRGRERGEDIWGQIICNLECKAEKLVFCPTGNMVANMSSYGSTLVSAVFQIWLKENQCDAYSH